MVLAAAIMEATASRYNDFAHDVQRIPAQIFLYIRVTKTALDEIWRWAQSLLFSQVVDCKL
jgi:hypothetical protein